MRMDTVTAEIEIDLSDVDIDWHQPVEIVDHGSFHSEWRLRDPEVGITVGAESYLEARQWLTAGRRVYERTQQAAQRAFEREAQRLVRDNMQTRIRGSGGVA